ncbi:MAG: sugar transporter [Herbinix sp.]|nr:sugar transporter [Herbinix sp.]
MEESKQYNRAKTWQIVTWPFHQVANSVYLVLMMFVSYIATGGFGIAVVTAGLIATYSRILDASIDPFIAIFTDRLNTRFGKIRILLVLGRTLQTISILMIFFWGIGHGVIIYVAFYSIYIIGSTISSIATNTGNPILTNDPKQRPKIFRWVMIYTTTVSTFTSFYLSKVLFKKHGALNVEALQELCITVIIIAVIFEIIAFIAISPNDRPEMFPKKANGKDVNLLDAWKLLKHNRALQTFVIAGVCDKVAIQAAGQSAITVLVFGVIIGNYGFFGNMSLINFIPTVLVLLFATKLASKHGTRKTFIQWTTISIILAVLVVLFLTISDPTKIGTSIFTTVIFCILFVGFNGAKMAVSACTSAMIPDIIDYELYKSGNFMPAVVSTIYSFVDEMVSSLSATIVAVLIAVIGYKESQPQPGDASTPALYWMTMFLWMGLPVLGYICSLIAMKWYPLTREMMVEVQAKNRERRETAKSA